MFSLSGTGDKNSQPPPRKSLLVDNQFSTRIFKNRSNDTHGENFHNVEFCSNICEFVKKHDRWDNDHDDASTAEHDKTNVPDMRDPERMRNEKHLPTHVPRL